MSQPFDTGSDTAESSPWSSPNRACTCSGVLSSETILVVGEVVEEVVRDQEDEDVDDVDNRIHHVDKSSVDIQR